MVGRSTLNDDRKYQGSMQTTDRVALVLLGALWSGGFLFTRIAVPAFGPLALVDLRVLIAGVAILVGLRPLSLTPAFAAAVCALLGAAALYAIGGVYTARRFTGASPVESTIGQQFGAFVLLLPFALAAPPTSQPPLSAVVALLILAVFSSVLAYLLFFRLISSVGATATATVSYLLPLFGTIWAVVVAQERIGLETLAGMLVISFGVVMATGTRLSRPRRRFT